MKAANAEQADEVCGCQRRSSLISHAGWILRSFTGDFTPFFRSVVQNNGIIDSITTSDNSWLLQVSISNGGSKQNVNLMNNICLQNKFEKVWGLYSAVRMEYFQLLLNPFCAQNAPRLHLGLNMSRCLLMSEDFVVNEREEDGGVMYELSWLLCELSRVRDLSVCVCVWFTSHTWRTRSSLSVRLLCLYL